MTWLKKHPAPEYLHVRWLKRQFLDDVILGSEFSAECKARHSHHICVDRNGKKLADAQFLITVRGVKAMLDYSHPRVSKYNEGHEIEPGKMSSVFADPYRTLVDEVIWQEPNGEETRKAAKTSWDMPDQ